MKGYPQYLWFVVLALLLVCTGCSNEGETEDDNNQHVKVEGFYVKGLENVNVYMLPAFRKRRTLNN